MRKTKRRQTIAVLLAWIPVVLCAVGIFLLSGQNGADSAALSSETMLPFVRLMEALFGENAHNVFRKFAHFFAYLFLMFFTYHALWRTKRSLSPVWPFVLCVAYAVSDEVHQYFVPDRACRLFDVGVDALGCVVGGLCFYGLICVIHFFQHRKAIGKRGRQT